MKPIYFLYRCYSSSELYQTKHHRCMVPQTLSGRYQVWSGLRVVRTVIMSCLLHTRVVYIFHKLESLTRKCSFITEDINKVLKSSLIVKAVNHRIIARSRRCTRPPHTRQAGWPSSIMIGQSFAYNYFRLL